MKQLSFAASEFAKKPKQTRREKFLLEVDVVVPWSRLLSVIEPRYPKAGNGLRPYELPTMLRIHFMQQCFGYPDAAMEEVLYEVPLLRHFAGLDAGTDTLPDETTILNFRHLLERYSLSSDLFAKVNSLLLERGLLLREGTDATLIAAPLSTKNREGKRDSDVTQTKKGNQWYFGMKAHIGVDDESGLVHTLIGITAKVSDMSQFTQLLHGKEERVSADRGYDYLQIHSHLQENMIEDWVALKGKPGKGLRQGLNHAIAQLRAIGEYPFRILKWQFDYIPRFAIAGWPRTPHRYSPCLCWAICFR